MIACLVAAILCGADGPENAARLSASDLDAYRAAIVTKDRGHAPRVEFRDLWQHDPQYRNRRVELDGRIVRRFSQPSVGRFPALTEFWVVNALGEPICVVVPTSKLNPDSNTSPSSVRFQGTYLRPLRYQASGGERVAPLVVASEGPEGLRAENVPPGRFSGDGMIAVGLAGLVVVVLLVQFLRKPARRARYVGTEPTFLQAGAEEAADGDGD
jgi:hypothetical protein